MSARKQRYDLILRSAIVLFEEHEREAFTRVFGHRADVSYEPSWNNADHCIRIGYMQIAEHTLIEMGKLDPVAVGPQSVE